MKEILDLENSKDENKEIILNQLIADIKVDDQQDSDNDGIPDDWEINGYTVEHGVIVKWDDSKHSGKGFIKYYSDPYDAYTAGGPYTDTEKILGKIDGNETSVHPLVATYPRINVEMEKMIFSKNVNLSQEEGKTSNREESKTVGISAANSHTDATTFGVATTIEVHASLTDIGNSVSVTANFSSESSNTVTSEKNNSDTKGQSSGLSLTKSLSLNQSEVAFLNGNIRYVNLGNMPIYNFKPTLNFVLGLGAESDTIATISAKANTLATVVLAGQKYPIAGQNAIAWNTSDDFNSQPIKLNYDQVIALTEWKPLQIQMTQMEGQYKKYDSNGEQYLTDYFKWEYVIHDIYKKTALITIAFADGQTFERRIAANSWENLKSNNEHNKRKIPTITIKEAIEIAFADTRVKNDAIYYKNKILNKNNLHLVVDETTNRVFKEIGEKNFFKTILTKEMKIMFIENKNDFNSNETSIDGGSLIMYSDVLKKLNHLDGSSPNRYLDLKNEISFEENLEENDKKLIAMIKKYLISSGFPWRMINNLEITWTYGISSKDEITSLEWEQFDVINPETWYKNINIKYKALQNKAIPLHFKNFLVDRVIDIQKVVPKIFEALKKINQEDENRIDLNNLIHFKTDLGPDLLYLKEIVKTYLITQKLLPSSVVDNIEIIFASKCRTLNEASFLEDDATTWFHTTYIRYYDEWESETFKLYIKNIRKSDEFRISLPQGISNYLEEFSKSLSKNWDQLAEILFLEK